MWENSLLPFISPRSSFNSIDLGIIPNLLDNQISGSVFSRRAALSGRVAIEDSAAAFRLALPKNPIAIGPIISKIWYNKKSMSNLPPEKSLLIL
jgi:hypothetical protein